MNKLNFIKADKPYRSNTTDSGKITVAVREFITTTLAEKIATALWNKPELADSIIRFNYDIWKIVTSRESQKLMIITLLNLDFLQLYPTRIYWKMVQNLRFRCM